jgi:hypothetical protein
MVAIADIGRSASAATADGDGVTPEGSIGAGGR